jgi:hypothetical protein
LRHPVKESGIRHCTNYGAPDVCEHALIQGTFALIQGTFGLIQGTFGLIQGTFTLIQGTFTLIQGTFTHPSSGGFIHVVSSVTSL